jgi:hypothetical protein
MPSLSAPAARGLSVLAIGGVLALSHVTFGAAKTKQAPVPPRAVAANHVDVSSTGSIDGRSRLADNCYWEVVSETNAAGRTDRHREEECD